MLPCYPAPGPAFPQPPLPAAARSRPFSTCGWRPLRRYIGVDRFYLRENGNSSAIAGDLRPYIDAGVVDFGLLEGTKHPTQTNWYNSCSKLAGRRHSWVAFIDLDEFIVVINRRAFARSLIKRSRALPSLLFLGLNFFTL